MNYSMFLFRLSSSLFKVLLSSNQVLLFVCRWVRCVFLFIWLGSFPITDKLSYSIIYPNKPFILFKTPCQYSRAVFALFLVFSRRNVKDGLTLTLVVIY